MKAPLPRRGEVWLADLPGDTLRPVVVLTRDAVLPRLPSVIVAPVTSTVRNIPSEVALSAKEGLRRPSVANFDNLQLVTRARLVKQVGRLGPGKLRDACAALRHAVSC